MRSLDVQALTSAQLRVTRLRLRAAVEASAEVADADVDAVRRSMAEVEAQETELEGSVRAALAAGAELPITWLRDRLGLSATEERLLWVLIAHELCPHARQLVRDLNSETCPDPTLDALRRAVYGVVPDARAWRELSPDGLLRRRCLIERTEGALDVPEHRITFRIARRVLALVHGVLGLDDDLAEIAELSPSSPAEGDLEIEAGARARVDQHIRRGAGLTVVYGRPGSGRRSLLLATASAAGHQVLTVDARRLASERERAVRQLRIIARECLLLRRVPLVLHLEALLGTGDAPDRLPQFEAEIDGFVMATASKLIARRWMRTPSMVELPPLKGPQRAALWIRALPMASTGDAELLSTMYPLAPALIQAVGTVAIGAANGAEMNPDHVEAGIRSVLDDRLAGLATRISVSQAWDDLILPEDQTTAIVELLARIRERRRVYEDWGFAEKLGKGLGVSALFSGPPGTGKTMCAGLIARDLRTELYQVDVSKIVSKWIGETQKNLATLFDAAEAGHAVLLFDEADALFGKRTDVKSSNDRHANQEVNYLLQRLESFGGICLLTTNHDAAIDEAFRRRLSIHVRFPVPDADEREKLWRAMLPRPAPVAPGIPFDELARKYVMSGGYIRNAVLRAAFLAADAGDEIAAEHLTHAAQLEYEAMGKLTGTPE